MFWPWGSTQVVGTEQERRRRVQEFKLQIAQNERLAEQLRAAGRDVQADEFASRWLASAGWDASSAMAGVSRHADWLSSNSAFVPASVSAIPRLLQESKELFLQVRKTSLSCFVPLLHMCTFG
jgi:hypothetical protein